MYDVVVVGYGPVGQLAALMLGRRGYRVAVFERRTQAFTHPRAVHLDDEAVRVLQSVGLAVAFTELAESPVSYQWRTADGRTLLEFDLTGGRWHGWPASSMFHQPDLERLLDEAVRAEPSVRVHRGHAVTAMASVASVASVDGVDGVDGGVEVTAAGRAERARYVLACDGAGGVCRGVVAGGVTDLGFTHDWLVVDVRPRRGTPADRPFDPPAVQVCDPRRPTTAVPGGPGRRRFEFMLLPGEDAAGMDRPEAVWPLLAPWGLDRSTCELERHAVYTFRARWANRWRRGRLLLAGDAAHEMPPFAGQGLSAGMRDVANLVWKLDLVLAGRAAEGLLDTYAAERIEHLRVATAISVELGKVICVLDPDEAARRDSGMLAARAAGAQALAPPPPPAIGPGLTRGGDPLAGQPFPQYPLPAGWFDDVAGPGPALVVLAGDVPEAVPPGGRLVDARGAGEYAHWLAGHGRPVVLVRPDRYVYGSAGSARGATELVAEFTRALTV